MTREEIEVLRVAGRDTMGDVYDLLAEYWDDVYDLEGIIESLRTALPKSKQARDDFFNAQQANPEFEDLDLG